VEGDVHTPVRVPTHLRAHVALHFFSLVLGKNVEMRFEVEHVFPGSVAAVAELLLDPSFHRALALPDLSTPEVVEASSSGENRLLKLRYEFVGSLDPIARRVIGGRRLTWIQELRLDSGSGVGTLSFSAEAEPKKLYGAADVALVAIDDGQTRRTVAGDLFVKVPLVGGTAERKIVPGLVRRLDVEADAVRVALTTP
jgi:hypothetical protein